MSTEKFRRFGRIRLKLLTFIVLILLIVTAASSYFVLRLMEENLLQALIRRGESVSLSITAPAAFHLLAGDRLALDNLVARLGTGQEDLVFAAITDPQGRVIAHSILEQTGESFPAPVQPHPLKEGEIEVRRVERYGRSAFEFEAPIFFAEKRVGSFLLGVDTGSLDAAMHAARERIFLISLAALGMGLAGALWLTRAFTRPIRRLAEGVADLQDGRSPGDLQVAGHDELAELTRRFNAMAQEIVRQRDGLAAYARDLEESYLSTLRLLAAAMDARDEYTLGHSTRVANLSVLLGRKIGMGESELKELAVSCFLHDVGKIRVPDHILNKRGPLSPRERDLILRHPEHGAEILRLADCLHKYIPAVLHHHEWFNGEGYPARLKGAEIPLPAAIVALADAYDAMTTSRPYRPGLGREEALRELRRFRGSQFSPDLVDLFDEVMEEYADGQLDVSSSVVA